MYIEVPPTVAVRRADLWQNRTGGASLFEFAKVRTGEALPGLQKDFRPLAV